VGLAFLSLAGSSESRRLWLVHMRPRFAGRRQGTWGFALWYPVFLLVCVLCRRLGNFGLRPRCACCGVVV